MKVQAKTEGQDASDVSSSGISSEGKKKRSYQGIVYNFRSGMGWGVHINLCVFLPIVLK